MLAEGMGFLETATGLCSSSSGLFGVGGGLFLGSPGGREGGYSATGQSKLNKCSHAYLIQHSSQSTDIYGK